MGFKVIVPNDANRFGSLWPSAIAVERSVVLIPVFTVDFDARQELQDAADNRAVVIVGIVDPSLGREASVKLCGSLE